MHLTYIQQAIKIKQLEEDNAYLQLAITEQRNELYAESNYSEFIEDKYNEKYNVKRVLQ